MKKEHIWEVKVGSPPLLKRKCNHCDSDRFYCSGKFRMNSQKRNIDVWLIYRCIKCDNTYNINILTRTKPELIDKNLFNNYLKNDTATAWKYAFSTQTAQKNKLELDFGSVDYDVQCDNAMINDILNFDSPNAIFKIKCPFDFSLKLASVIRTGLKLSANQLNLLIKAKVVSIRGKPLRKKHKLKNGDVVQINRDNLRALLLEH